MHVSLPRQIVIIASTAFVLFTSTLWISVISIRDEMDNKAFSESIRLMRQRIEASQEQVRVIASDYNNWNDVYDGAMSGDIAEIANNYGITAARGDVFQYAAMFDGPFKKPIAWVAGKGLSPQGNILPDSTMEAIRQHARELTVENRETFDYFAIMDGELVMFSASFLLPEDLHRMIGHDRAQVGLASIGKILTAEKMAQIQEELLVTSLRFTPNEPAAGLASIPLIGATSTSVAWLVWDHPSPGTDLFNRMFSILIVVSGVFAGLTLMVTFLIHSQARALMRKEAEAAEQARTDILTGLPNRLAFLERINNGRTGEMAILAIDLDRFKQVNDVIGHSGGDLYLKSLAQKLKCLADDRSFVARIGGDEFVAVFQSNFDLQLLVEEKMAALDQILAEPILYGGFSFDVSASKGLAFSKGADYCPADLLGRADRAMYYAKVQGVRDVTLYDEAMEAKDQSNSAIDWALRSAISTGSEFSLDYQPIVSATATGRIIRAEALLRWTSATLGRLGPSDFIPVAERSGLIFPLGRIVIDMVCRDLAAHPALSVAINVSPLQLMAPGFAGSLIARVAEYSIECQRIEIEVTENVAILDDEIINRELLLLRDAGFSIALDDFGTGFASIGYLNRMPIDVIKIDKSYISGESGYKGKFCLIKSMISLAHSIGIAVVAEGVEHQDELDRLLLNGCDYVQGYLTGRPVDLLALVSKFDLKAALMM